MKIKSVFLFVICSLVLTACSKRNINSSDNSIPDRVEVIDAILYGEYTDMTNTFSYEPLYTDAEWIKDGTLLYPYKNNLDNDSMKTIEDILANFYVSEEVVAKASTKELLKVSGDFLTTKGIDMVYNLPSEYVCYVVSINLASNELLHRTDMPEVIFEDYNDREYAKASASYDEVRINCNQIMFEEIVLASNYAFSIMDDELKEKVLAQATDMADMALDDNYDAHGLKSGFFTYIIEEKLEGGSDWYDYIVENNHEGALAHISDAEHASWR